MITKQQFNKLSKSKKRVYLSDLFGKQEKKYPKLSPMTKFLTGKYDITENYLDKIFDTISRLQKEFKFHKSQKYYKTIQEKLQKLHKKEQQEEERLPDLFANKNLW